MLGWVLVAFQGLCFSLTFGLFCVANRIVLGVLRNTPLRCFGSDERPDRRVNPKCLVELCHFFCLTDRYPKHLSLCVSSSSTSLGRGIS